MRNSIIIEKIGSAISIFFLIFLSLTVVVLAAYSNLTPQIVRLKTQPDSLRADLERLRTQAVHDSTYFE